MDVLQHGTVGVIVHRIVYVTFTTMAFFGMVHATVFAPLSGTGVGGAGVDGTGVGDAGVGGTGVHFVE